ncbi:MAG TPA: beta-propeller fold lactonase family protein [Terracidiphilus sp.]|jgi:6-phosphogluconolactonase (cycloisomerase 2 family)
MKFTKFGKALLMGALSAGLIFGVTSCVESYTVGYLYVTGTVTAQSGNNGIITGFKIDHNTGKLSPINGLPVSSGGSNPVRAVLLTGSRFLYVLNRGVNTEGNADCTPTDPCGSSNITQFAVGGNGVLTPQETFFTQGVNPFRLIADTTGSYLLALDHDSSYNGEPSSATNPNPNCARALANAATTCGDVTVFQINQTTGRLSLVLNAQVTAASGSQLTYFPVPANPVDFVMATGFVLTLSGNTPQTSYPYTGGGAVWPYAYSSSTGQLTVSSNSSQPLTDPYNVDGLVGNGTAIVSASSVIYVLDNESFTLPSGGTFPGGTYPSQVLPYTVGSGGALQSQTGGIIPDDPTLGNPIQLLVESKGKYVYVANQGNNVTGNNPQSGIAAYFITTAPAYQLSFVPLEPFGSGSGPQCIVEDPSDQFIYEANEYDSTVTGRSLDPNSGALNLLRVTSSYPLQGPATWCLINGRTG